MTNNLPAVLPPPFFIWQIGTDTVIIHVSGPIPEGWTKDWWTNGKRFFHKKENVVFL